MGCSTQDSAEKDIIAAVLEEFPACRRCPIARCLCGGSRLVLLDEPTEGIQPSIIEEIVKTLQRCGPRAGSR